MENPIVNVLKSQIGNADSTNPSPAVQWLQGTLQAVEAGEITQEHFVRKDMCNPMGVLHGGVSSLILDDIIGMTIFSLCLEYMYTSINLSVDFLKAVKSGEVISSQARVLRQGKNVIHVVAEIRNASDELVVKAQSNMGRTSVKNPFYPQTSS